ncbi:MAG: DegT/DnrJ/EryC1/StrS family aminotransferase [Candidatus Latescibacteria bacterium]|nr:DegT/DnrJ/EryC1/StrS family aminotransferase [Candidatus Latescibacterota bacterium]
MSGRLALFGGKPELAQGIADPWPQFDQTEETMLLEVLRSRNWNHGPMCLEFEEKFAHFQDAAYGVVCNGGTNALEAACRGAEIGIGDEVITSPYTFHGTCMGILAAGATVTFADIAPNSDNMDPDAIEAAITPRTKAIMVVHFGGLACDMRRIQSIADRHDLVVLEDACHGWGAAYMEKGLGSWGLASGFSFQRSKNMTCGEGGIALTNDEDVADRMNCVINSGRPRFDRAPEGLRWGGNHRMTDFAAAILLCQLKRVRKQTDIREQNAAMLTRTLSRIDGIEPVDRLQEATRASWHIYSARYEPEEFDGVSRERFLQALRAEGVPAGGGYTEPVYRNPIFQNDWKAGSYRPFAWTTMDDAPDYRQLRLPNAEKACKDRIWLSQTVLLASEAKMTELCRAFEKVRTHAADLR